MCGKYRLATQQTLWGRIDAPSKRFKSENWRRACRCELPVTQFNVKIALTITTYYVVMCLTVSFFLRCFFLLRIHCTAEVTGDRLSTMHQCHSVQWRRYTRVRQVKWSGWKIHRPAGSTPGSALPSPVYCFVSVIVWTENKNVTISNRFICFISTVKRRWRPVFWGQQLKKVVKLFWRKKVHPGYLAGGFSDLEMTWLLYCAGAATASVHTIQRGPKVYNASSQCIVSHRS